MFKYRLKFNNYTYPVEKEFIAKNEIYAKEKAREILKDYASPLNIELLELGTIINLEYKKDTV